LEGKTFDLIYDITSSGSCNYIKIYTDDDANLASSTSGSLSGSVQVVDPSTNNVYVYSSGGVHTLKVDLVESKNVGEEFETFVEITGNSDYLGYHDTDYTELLVTRSSNIHMGPVTLDVYTSGEFGETSLTWDNKPGQYNAISSYGLMGSPTIIPINLGYTRDMNVYFKIDSAHGGVDYWSPVVRYSYDKFHQEGSKMYMQTNETEFLTLNGPKYATNTSMTKNDQLILECKGNTDESIYFALLSGGEVVANHSIITDFTSQIFTLEMNTTIEFDQIKISGLLDDKEYFLVNSITLMEGASVVDTKVSEYDITINQHKPEFIYGNPTSDASFILVQDDKYSNASSTKISDLDYRYETKFEFDLSESDMDEVTGIEIQMSGFAINASLEGALFEVKNWITSGYEVVSHSVKDGKIIFSISETQLANLNLTGENPLLFKITIKTSSAFTVCIDKLSLVTLKEWNAEHDLYRAAFTFERTGTETGNIIVAVNDQVSLTIANNNPDLKTPGNDNVVSIYYDCATQKWSGFINDKTTDLLNVSDTGPVMIPRIESRFSSDNDGIIVKYLESQYYKKIIDQDDFDKYNTLILSYEAKEGYADSLDLGPEESLITPENLFAQICADIDVIYSFNDEMSTNNVFSYNFNPTYSLDNSDNLAGYIFNETSYVLEDFTSLVYNFVTNSSGNNYTPVYSNTPPNNVLDDPDSGYYQPTTTGFDVRSTGYYTDVDGGNGWTTGPNEPADWYEADDDNYRYAACSASYVAAATDTYEFEDLPSWANESESKKLKFKAWFNVGSGDYNYYCKLYLYNWEDEQWETTPAATLTEGQWNTFSIDITYEQIQDNKVHFYFDCYSYQDFGDFQADIVWSNEYCYLELKNQDLLASDVSFSFDSLLDGLNDFYLDFRGMTSEAGWTSQLRVNDGNIQSFGYSWTTLSHKLITDVQSIKTWIANADEEFYPGGELTLDFLRLLWINQPVNISLYNSKSVNLTRSLSRTHTTSTPIDSGFYNDPYFGKNSLKFTIKNTITTPKFGRSNGSVFADSSLSAMDLEFTVFPNKSYPNFPLEHVNVEGNDGTLYNATILNEYNAYSLSRFRNSALDDIQIPLVTPIELDFGEVDITELTGMELEIALGLSFGRNFAVSDSTWSLRFRLMCYNYTSGAWEDFDGILRAKNKGLERYVWGSVSNNFVEYLQYPQSTSFIPVTNENDIHIANPLVLKGATNDTISNGIMKLAFVSYVLPSNYSIGGGNKYFTYEREDPQIPIEIYQNVEVLECLFIGETVEIMYPDSAIQESLDLDENFRANLSLIDNLGDITAVSGVYIDKDDVKYEYPIFSYWTTSGNELRFNSPMKYLFSSVNVEYIPEIELVLNNGKYYLPNSSLIGGQNFTQPFFVTNLKDDSHIYGTYIHPDVDVGYYLNVTNYGICVVNSTNFDGIPRGSVRYTKSNDTYFYQFSLKDELIYKYNVLSSASDLVGGELQLELNAGFKDVVYSDLSQVTCSDYILDVELFQLNTATNSLKKIGKISSPLDQSLLYYHSYQIDLDLDVCNFEPNGRERFAETIARGSGYDLYITVNSTIYNCYVDGNLFKGLYGHELLSAKLRIDAGDADLQFNGDDVDDTFIDIPQKSVMLTKTGEATYNFDPISLPYRFEFMINELRTETSVIEQSDFEFSFESLALSLSGPFSDYSGLLFADITYKAFKWSEQHISTLEPITITFTNDYTKNITEFFELIVQYNSIPGYHMEKISETSGRLVLSEEEKDASLLKVYMYNIIEIK
jgi:hypothetical protein